MAARDHPTREEIESWDERETLSVYTDLGLRGGRTHPGRQKLILQYFGIRHLKREAEEDCASPSTAHVGGSRQTGETPETVRQLPMPRERLSTTGDGGNGGGRAELGFGGEPFQRQFTDSMEQGEVMDHQVAQEESISGQGEQQRSIGSIWTAPDLPQFQTKGDHSGLATGKPLAPQAPMGPPAQSQRPPPSHPKRRLPPLSCLSRMQLTQLDVRPEDAAIEQLTDAGLRAMLLANGLPRANTDRRKDFARHLIAYLAEDPLHQLAFPPLIAQERDLQRQAERD